MKPLIYIVEDDQNLATIYQEAFLNLGFEPVTIRNGQDALITFQKEMPRLPNAIFLDLHLPDVSGAEILTYLRNEPRFDLVKIVVVSADSVQLRKPEIQEKANLTALKPLRFTQLVMLAKRVLDED